MPDITQITPQQAQEILTARANARMIDVRSKVEFDYVGHALGALHVAWKEFPDWSENPQFVEQVKTALRAQGLPDPLAGVPLVLICRSGARSQSAAKVLRSAGFQELYNIYEGFEGDKDASGHRNIMNGWRAAGLPWEQT